MSQPIPVFKNNPVMVLILGFLTCGLYLIYWNIKMSKVLNAIAEREVISQTVAIISGCIYPINVYFYYLVGNDVMPKLYEKLGEPKKDQTTTFVILGLFLPSVAAMIVQGEVNKLYELQ